MSYLSPSHDAIYHTTDTLAPDNLEQLYNG